MEVFKDEMMLWQRYSKQRALTSIWVVQSKIAEIFANPSKQKNPCSWEPSPESTGSVGSPTPFSHGFPSLPVMYKHNICFSPFALCGEKNKFNFFLGTRDFFFFCTFSSTDANKIVAGSLACVHLCECKIKGEKMADKHVTVILSVMGLEMLQFKDN